MNDFPTSFVMPIVTWFAITAITCMVIAAIALNEKSQPETKTECLENGSSVMEIHNLAFCSLNNDGDYYLVEDK